MSRIILLVQAPEVRPTTIHKAPCKHCPSAHHPPDPESLDIMTWPREQQREALFACGWRPDKLCKGQCDELGFTEEDLMKGNRPTLE